MSSLALAGGVSYRAARRSGGATTTAAVSTAGTAPDAAGAEQRQDDRDSGAARVFWWLLLVGVVVVPRCYLWGTVPAGVHGDEGGFAALGVRMFAAPEPLWSFGPQSLPNAHFWLYGAAVRMFGVSIWSVRFVVGVFGALQALAIVDIAGRSAGRAAALTAAVVMAIPLQLHFDRLAMCNVMTVATWTFALWCVVRFPTRALAAVAAGALLAVGWYGYQAASIAPLIAGAGVAALVWRGPTRRLALRQLGLGVLSFAVAIAPLAYGFYLAPNMLFGRALGTSWLAETRDPWSELSAHLSATGSALVGLRFDQSGGFFPFQLPVVPIGLIGLAAIGLVACRPAALRLCLIAWFALVIAGNTLRAQYVVYSPVLICMVPALALASAFSARWLRWLAPVIAIAVTIQPVRQYFAQGRAIPFTEILPMAQAAAIEQHAEAASVFVAGGLGCEHGLTAWALHGRPCRTPANAELSTATPAQLFILYPPFFTFDGVLATRSDVVLTEQRFGSTPVHVWAPPPGVSAPPR